MQEDRKKSKNPNLLLGLGRISGSVRLSGRTYGYPARKRRISDNIRQGMRIVRHEAKITDPAKPFLCKTGALTQNKAIIP